MKKLNFIALWAGMMLLSITNGFTQPTSGTTGPLNWAITGSGYNRTLTITGNGAMPDYTSTWDNPWYDWGYSDYIATVVIGDGVTKIGMWAFWDCNGLKTVTIPNSVTIIGVESFKRCWSLSSITIPNSVTTIGDGAFSNSGLKSITIPNSVRTIGSLAFEDCDFTTVTIPDSVTTIGDYVFQNCNNLTSATIGNGLTTTGTGTFFECEKLSSVTIGSNVTLIGKYAFAKCLKLKTVTVGNNVATIGDYAFAACTTLTSLSFPNSLKTIADFAFYQCLDLNSVDVGNSITGVGAAAFAQCTTLISLNFPNTLKTIGDFAFADCFDLTAINIGNSVTTIGKTAFGGCHKLTSITIPNSVTAIGEEVFKYCLTLKTLTLPFIGKSPTDHDLLGKFFGEQDGGGVPELQAVTQHYKTYFGVSTTTYYLPKTLTKLVITNATELNFGALSGCTMLKEVTLPKTLSIMGERTMYGCSGLEHIYELRENPPAAYDNTTFFGIDKYGCILHVPVNSQTKYATANGWKEFFNIQEDGQGEMPKITTNNLPDGTIGTAYSATLTATGSTPLTWSISSGNLPNGLSLSTSGIISGTPNVAGTSNFTVKVTNSEGENTKALSIVIGEVGIAPIPNSELRVYPNPTTGQLRIKNYELRENTSVEIFDIYGRLVYAPPQPSKNTPPNLPKGEEQFPSFGGVRGGAVGEVVIDISHLANGLYFLKIDNKTIKVIKQ